MSRNRANFDPSTAAELDTLHYTTTPQSAHMEARLAELDAVHSVETKRLGALIAAAKKRLSFPDKTQKGQAS